jgi:uncharacterized protein (DUF1697 family)
MIAQCSKCGLVFEGRGIFIQNGNVLMSNNTNRCPICKATAYLLEGNFVINEGQIIKVLSAPQFTKDILEKLKILAEQAKENEYSPQEFQTQANKISKEAGFVARLLTRENIRDFMTALGVLIAALAYMHTLKEDNPQPSTNTYINSPLININGTPTKQPSTKSKGSNYTSPKKKRKKGK